MQFFKTLALVAAAVTAVVAGPTLQRREGVVKYQSTYYSAEVQYYQPKSTSTDYGDYSFPSYVQAPSDVYVDTCARRSAHHMRDFFHELGENLHRAGHDIHMFFHHLHEKISEGWHDFIHGLKHSYDCLAFQIHVQWKKLTRDAERIKWWFNCEARHFKYWCEYREKVIRGEIKVYTKFAHEMMCALREFEARERDTYTRRRESCRSADITGYSEKDTDYVTLVGRSGVQVDGEVIDLSFKAQIQA